MALAYEADNEPDERSEEERAEREDKLIRMLKAEEEQSLGYAESEVTGQQIEALKRYFGEPYGDEEEGRSQVCTREVFETIEWTRPDIMRAFASGSNIVTLEETSDQDSKYAKDAADYLSWIFFTDNPGFENLDNFAFDGLLHRRGYMACYWRDKEYRAPQKLTGLNIMQVQQLMQDPAVEIVGQDFDNESEAGGIQLIVRRAKSPARAEIVTVAPEDMRFSGRAVAIDGGRYVGCVQRMLAGEAGRLWPDKADEILSHVGREGAALKREDVRQERFRDDNNDWLNSNGNETSQEVEILEEYLRVDLDEDGYPETIRSYRIGDVLLEESEVEENPFGSWTPIRIPHRFMGLSQADITMDLQRRSTVLTRAGLDAVYQSVVNREAFDTTKLGEDGAMALLSTVAGTKIPVSGDPNGAIAQLSGGVNTAPVAWEALNQMAATLENRTGATRQTQGMDPDALLKGAHSGKAIDLLQTAGGARKELIARNMAAGLEAFMAKVYRLVCRNQNEPRQAKVGGKACTFDPRTWNSDLRVTVHAGLGTGNRDQTLMGLTVIGQDQQLVIQTLGVDNPLVTPQHFRRTFEEKCRALGYRSADAFMADPPDVPDVDPKTGQPAQDPQTGQLKMKPWAPPPAPNPEAMKIQAEQQMSQTELQHKEQLMNMQFQKDTQLAQTQQQDDLARANNQHEKDMATSQLNLMSAQQAAADAARAHEIAMEKLSLERDKALAEVALKHRELELKEAEIAQRGALDERKIEHDGKQKDADRSHKIKEAKAVGGHSEEHTEAVKALIEEIKKPRKISRDPKTREMVVT